MMNISNPEISQAFYGELKGEYDYYTINSVVPFNLYLQIVVPGLQDSRKDFVFDIYAPSRLENGTTDVERLGQLDGYSFKNWTKFYEDFGGDNYLSGPEFDMNVSAGEYKIVVHSYANSSNYTGLEPNKGKYTLVVGKAEKFSLKDILVLPKIKHDFFGKSYFAFFEGIIGKAVGVLLLAVILIVLLIVWVFRRFKKK